MVAPRAGTQRWSSSGYSAPTLSLMFVPVGETPMATTRAPRRRNTIGATR